MGEGVNALLAKRIELADQVAKQSGSGQCLRPECKELRARAEKLAEVLRQATRADLYERPAERIVAGTLQELAKAGGMSARCFENHSRVRRFLTFNPFPGFPRTLALLDTAVEDVAWLTRISPPRADADANANGTADDADLRGLPNIAQNEPILFFIWVLFFIWDHIARLHTGSLAVRADSASTLASLARYNPTSPSSSSRRTASRPSSSCSKKEPMTARRRPPRRSASLGTLSEEAAPGTLHLLRRST